MASLAAACRPDPTPDAWYAAPPAPVETDQALAVARDQLRTVDAAHLAAAEQRLASAPWVPVDDAAALGLGTGGVPLSPNTRLYLLRALVLEGTEATGSFRVTQNAEGDVHVHWGCLGSGRRPMQRRVVVVPLGKPPCGVWVTTSMAR